MQLKNPFPQTVRLLYLDVYECVECFGNGTDCGGLELHHIWGRISASALNSALLCKRCHERMNHNREEHHRLLRKTIRFLVRIGYELQPVDQDFLTCVQNDLRGFTP